MRTKCPVCKKNFDMMHPSLWAYNINKKQFFCSWKCLQKHRAQEEERKLKITLEQKKKAVEIAVKGGDVMAFLRECGSENPGVTWSNIYRTLEKVDPEAYDLITCRKKAKVDKGMPKKDDLPVVKITGPIMIETPEAKKVEVVETPEGCSGLFHGTKGETTARIVTPPINKPVVYDGMIIREVEGAFGRYRYSDIGTIEYIDFESTDQMDVLSLSIGQWRNFREEQRKAAAILGVEL